MNPYYRTICARMTYPNLASPGANNGDDDDIDDEDVLSVLPQFECGLFFNFHSDSCPSCLGEAPNKEYLDKMIAMKHECCKKDMARNAAYRKIKAKARQAVKVSVLQRLLDAA